MKKKKKKNEGIKMSTVTLTTTQAADPTQVQAVPTGQPPSVVVQYGPAGSSSSNATYAMTPFASPIVAGNAIFVFVSWQTNAGTITSVSDNINAGAYTMVPNSWAQSTSGCSGAWFYKLNSTAGSPTVTVVRSAGQAGGNVAGYEVSGVDASTPIDAEAVAKAGVTTGAGTVTVGTVTTLTDNTLLLTGYRGTFSGLGAGWTSNQTGSHTLGNMIGASPGSYTATATASSSTGWKGSVFAIRSTPAETAPPPTTYENWIRQQNDWIRANPPVPD
jgi:hypothetical protein